jgi:uncharacterized membrane protein YdjX (TVP38/TMEM64 family)
VARSFRLTAGRKSAGPRRPRPTRQPLRLADFPWGKIVCFALVLGVIAALVYSRIDLRRIHEQAAGFNGGLAFALLVVLPLVGFPASLLHLAAGIRFGAVLGLTLVSFSILLQLLASYGIVRLWRPWFEQARWLKKIRARIPHGAHAGVCVVTVLLPGAPYAAVNYVLSLMGVSLRTFILCAWPLHTLRSTITVLFGDQSAHLTAARLAVLMAYALTIFAASWWTYRRLQARFEGRRPTADDRKPPG